MAILTGGLLLATGGWYRASDLTTGWVGLGVTLGMLAWGEGRLDTVDTELAVLEYEGDWLELLNLAEKEGDGRAEEVTMVEVRVFKLVAGDSAMKEGEASGLEDDGEKEEEVEMVGAAVMGVLDIVLVEESVAGLIMSDLPREGESFEGGGCRESNLIAALSLELLEESCLLEEEWLAAGCVWEREVFTVSSLSCFLFLLSLSAPEAGEDSLFFSLLSLALFSVRTVCPGPSCSSFFTDFKSGEVSSSSVQTLHLHFLG